MIWDQFMFMGDNISPMRSLSNRLCDDFLYKNCDMDTFASRVHARRTFLSLSQKDLAKKAGLSQTTISDIERGRNDGSRDMVGLAKALQCRAEWLKFGSGPMEDAATASFQDMLSRVEGNVEPAPNLVGKVPLISWVQAGLFCSSPDLLHPGDAEDWIQTPKKYGPHTYALRVVGESMISPNPAQVSYHPGLIIIIDPERPVTNGCRVVARINGTDEATFKVYSEDAGQRFLKPLNPQYPTILMTENMHICGVVVGSWRDE